MDGIVLIAERDPFDLRLLQELCEESGFDVVTAADGESALNVIARQRPALVVLDAELATEDGPSVLEVLVSDPALRAIPVLLTTRADDDEARRRGLLLGAADFVARPYRAWEVEHRIASLLRLSAAERALARRGSALTPPDEGMDPVTRAGGPAQLRATLEYEASRAVRYGHPLTCLALRVSNLSAVRARGGEDAAVGLLAQLAVALRRAIRGIDHLFRADTDELVMLLPETSRSDAEVVVRRLRDEASVDRLGALAIEPPPALALGVASIEAGDPLAPHGLVDGERLLTAARDALSPL